MAAHRLVLLCLPSRAGLSTEISTAGAANGVANPVLVASKMVQMTAMNFILKRKDVVFPFEMMVERARQKSVWKDSAGRE